MASSSTTGGVSSCPGPRTAAVYGAATDTLVPSPTEQIADSQGYYPGEKGYNPNLAPPPMPVAPQADSQGGGASDAYVEGSEVFIPDGFGGFVRRPYSPPPMEKKVGK